MRRNLIMAALAMGLAGCGVLDTLWSGLQHAKAVSASLKATVGVEPGISFDWQNGHLQHVTVTFPRLVAETSLTVLADMTRDVVIREFEQKPERIILAFEVTGADTATIRE